MLTWVGKRPLSHVTAFPAQHIETFDPTGSFAATPASSGLWEDWPVMYPRGGLLFHGDNKEVLAHLLANGFRGKVNLIYIDPPFDSGADYVRKAALRGPKGAAKIDGETHTLGEQLQYTDIWANDNYLQFMYERLLLLRELLANNGSIWLHCDDARNYFLRFLLDEVFGPASFVNETVWKRADAHNDSLHFATVHDTLYLYTKADDFFFHRLFVPLPKGTADTWYRHVEPETARRYNLADISSPHPRPNLMFKFRSIDPPAFGWRYSKQRMEELYAAGRLVFPAGKVGTIKLKRYLDESKGILMTDWWDDITMLRGLAPAGERTDYPTQKPEPLLERIVRASSRPGDVVLDCFLGSGTTVTVAQKLGRRWIGCDINKGAIQTTAKRLQAIIQEQITSATEAESRGVQPPLAGLPVPDGETAEGPTHLGFTVWRVNDYDLTIQHNEAVNLACEHIGVERTRSDSFFEGTRGRSLVKIIPFTHPLSPLDLQEIKRELEARPNEDRPITVVCLGQELAARAWVEEWNRLRKGKDAVNRIEVIELRTDPKHGRFIRHERARAKVKIVRKNDKILVKIEDFISPTIIERLQQQAGVLKPTIEDWRAMVDCVSIDPGYDCKVFTVALSDVPEKKTDLVKGRYELSAPARDTIVAVKIIDMLGEEVLVVNG